MHETDKHNGGQDAQHGHHPGSCALPAPHRHAKGHFLREHAHIQSLLPENMVAIPPHNFCTQISIRKAYGIYKQNFKRKVVGWNGGGVL